MKVENIKSNGISYNKPAKNVAEGIILTAISLYRMRHTEKEIFDMFPEGEYHSGTRFNDNKAVCTRICSALTTAARISLFGTQLVVDMDEKIPLFEGVIKSFVDSLSGKEMDIIILDGMKDCASADHWYTFEKDWN